MKEEKNQNLKYACLFGGGAIRGSAHVGVIKALEELDINITTIAGSSVGSIIAALYTVGYTQEELLDVFLSVNFELFRDFSFIFNQKFALSKGEIFLDWIRELIEKKFYGQNYKKGENAPVCFKDIDKDLVIITTNLYDFSCKEFSTFETPDFEIATAVRISCCMPGLMRSVHIDNKMLVDGDLMKGKPMWSLSPNLRNLKDRILEIRLEGTFNGSDQSPIDYVNGMYSCMTSSETDFIKSIYGKNDKYDYLVIDTGDVVVVDFNYPVEKRQSIVDRGYIVTKNYFTMELLLKKQKLNKIYTELLDTLRKIQGFMLRNKYIKVRTEIANLFILLANYEKYIDVTLYDAILLFQKLTYSNIKTGLLGSCSCNNKQTVSESLNSLINEVTKKVSETEFYINKFSD